MRRWMLLALVLLGPVAALADDVRGVGGECRVGAKPDEACTLDDGTSGTCTRARCVERRRGLFKSDKPILMARGGAVNQPERECLRCQHGGVHDDDSLPPIVWIAGSVALVAVVGGVLVALSRSVKKPPAPAA